MLSPLISGLSGVHLRHNINNHLSLEYGFIFQDYIAHYDLKINDSFGITSYGNSFKILQVPLRIRWHFNLYRNKIFLSPLIGIHLAIHRAKEAKSISTYNTKRSSSITDSVFVTETGNYLHKVFPLLEAGLSLEFRIGKLGMLSLSGGYYAGLVKIYQLDIDYHLNNDPSSRVSSYTRGSCWNFGFCYNFCISELWKKRLED